MTRNATPQQSLKQIPKKWAVAIVVALIAYALVQPFVNGRFGWGLPSLAGVLGMEKPAAKKPIESNSSIESGSKATKETDQSGSQETTQANLRASHPESELASDPSDSASQTEQTSPLTKPTESQTATKKTTDEKQPTAKTPATGNSASITSEPKQRKSDAAGELLYGLLKDTGREVYVSPAGLRYTRGSEEGHRLKHLEKHLKDIPDRPGKHGVFDGDMAQVLRWIDDAYTRGKQGAKGVRKQEEDGRTVYEVPFTKPIGYVGGRDGKRDNNPDAKRLRLVVDGDQVITAFPF
jgi:hypothetical protein